VEVNCATVHLTGVLMHIEQYRDTGFTNSLAKAIEIADKLNVESELKTTLRSKRRIFECEEADLPI
jgi:hypothetical protein